MRSFFATDTQSSQLDLTGIDIHVVHTSLDLFVEKNIKWSDALIAARMLEWGYTAICTFDHHFKQIPGITRVEP
mgnify:CR=1